jgi:hypothetical protein
MSLSSGPRFPPHLKELFESLANKVTWLHAKWDCYLQLFGTPESVAIMTEVASGGSYLLRKVIADDLMLGIARLLDPRESRVGKKTKKNLTISHLLYEIKQDCANSPVSVKLDRIASQLDAKKKPILEHRNRAIAHLDFETAMERHPDPLQSVSRTDFEQILNLIVEFMIIAQRHYERAIRIYSPNMSGPAKNIVDAMREFTKFKNEERTREIEAAKPLNSSTLSV